MELKTKTELVEFETRIANLFNAGKIRFPIHLSSNNQEKLIEIFKLIDINDWIFSSWRSHYHCLLKGVPELEVENAILEGRSISLNFPSHRIFSSAIVGGQISQAIGVALAIKMKESNEKVWCFIGDMTSETGVAQTAMTYALNFDLPIFFVIEDNEKSVLTDTRKVWGTDKLRYELNENPKVLSYKYKNNYPHAGAGMRVQF